MVPLENSNILYPGSYRDAFGVILVVMEITRAVFVRDGYSSRTVTAVVFKTKNKSCIQVVYLVGWHTGLISVNEVKFNFCG